MKKNEGDYVFFLVSLLLVGVTTFLGCIVFPFIVIYYLYFVEKGGLNEFRRMD